MVKTATLALLTLAAFVAVVAVQLSAPAVAQDKTASTQPSGSDAAKPPLLSAVDVSARPAPPMAASAPTSRPAKAVASARPKARTMEMIVTAYCPCTRCCGPNAQGITASGKSVLTNRGRFVAADTTVLPMYSHVKVPGYAGGVSVPVLDRGGAIKGNRLDVYFPSHEQAKEWGRKRLTVTIVG